MTRGRTATVPREIPLKGWKDIALRLKDEVAQDRVGLMAAGVAFYGLLALFPAITAMLAIGGLMVEPDRIVKQLSVLEGVVPQEVLSIITTQATAVAGAGNQGLGLAALFGILLALYSASKGMGSLMQGLNVAYDEEETRGFFAKTTITLALTLFLIFGLLAGMGATLVVPAALQLVDAGPLIGWIGTGLTWVLLIALTLVGLAVVYRYGPSRDAPEFRWVSWGAAVACVLWIVGSVGFAFYISNFGTYNESFGTLAGVVVLLMWFWISAFIILLGAELNAEMEAQTAHDTTVGMDREMGARDAVKADRLGARQTA